MTYVRRMRSSDPTTRSGLRTIKMLSKVGNVARTHDGRPRDQAPRAQAPQLLNDSAGYEVEVSTSDEDAVWDAFLLEAPGGHHVQSSLWGQLKASEGWRPVRILVRRNDELVAGVQVLIRSLPLIGGVAYAPRGPVFGSPSPELRQIMLDQLNDLITVYRVRHLTIQPPDDGQAFEQTLQDAGYRPSAAAVAPVATVQVDLRPEPSEILARMRTNHRRFVRHGLRQGVSGRLGSRDDLEGFYDLVLATSGRHGFEPYPFDHFVRLWDLFHPRGLVQLFLSEYRGELVSGQLAVAFGNRVTAKNSGWTGEKGNLGPNYVMEWTTIEWARSNGYRYYDLEGIDVRAARLKLKGEPLPEELRRTHSCYKLGFGDVVMFPGPQVTVPNRVLRWCYWTVFPRVSQMTAVRSAINRLRTRWKTVG